ncbi:PhzF family phenazine biosynthesis protein [Maricaulis sp.]|uniref:PhzF family phenazine biosynthesis protein n=1 Tax=Maricaulis sp. TaxID=1486257 RepID=UPI003A93AA5B
MSSIPYFEIHAFAEPGQAFTGNPAGVCLLEAFPGDRILKGIAASNNLSETAFLVPGGKDRWQLRWFTPALEVDLCGHATLAAGAVVLTEGRVAGDAAVFDTRSGELRVRRDGAAFAMDLPQIGFRPGGRNQAIEAALGVDTGPVAVMNVNRIHGARYQMWVMADEAAVRLAEPDHGRLRQLDTNIILTAPGEHTDFVSRFFAPASGVDEDPVTGSAHCTLAPYWGERLGKTRMSARQIGPRPGALEVELQGERVALYGHAPRYLEGRITL